jgi:hypothetical protein
VARKLALMNAAEDLLAALKETTAIVDGELAMIIDSCSIKGDLRTLDVGVKPDVEKFQRAIKRARGAIAKAEGRKPK